jgi:presequence protease
MHTFAPDSELRPGARLHGFRVQRREELPNLRATAIELVHEGSGLRHLHIAHELEENVFLLAFRTLPEDSTGVAHILEHSVLEGSRRFPVKMFNLLVGRSLNSFLNAFTGPDKTVYPFATPNPVDYDNLLVRYLDAGFHPLLEEETLLQEGWRLEFEDPEDPASPLRFKGVVFNEMKAALSSPDGQFARRLRRELLPDICYRHESGGDPEAIPELSLEAWRAFHARHYHPANAWTASFGNLPLTATLKRIDEAVAGFGPGAASQVGESAPWAEPRRLRASYPAPRPREGQSAGPAFAAVGWRLCPLTDLDEALRLSFLFDVIAGGLSAPVNHALLKSGLAPALAPTGFDSGNSRLSWAVGLKGLELDAVPRLEELLLATLRRLVDEGLDPVAVRAALDRFELETREQSRVWGMPWGLSLLYFNLSGWMGGGDGIASLRSDRMLASLRRDCEDPGFLPGLIRRWLLDNPERLTLAMDADAGGLEAREERERARLAGIAASLDDEARVALVEQSRRVARWRERRGDLSCMPELDPADLPRRGLRSRAEERPLAGRGLLLSEQPTNGLLHLKLAFPLDATHPDLPLVDLLGWLPRLSHGGLGVEASEQRIRALTGGISLGSDHGLPVSGGNGRHELRVDLHGLASRAGDWLQLLQDLLRRPDLADGQRLGELLRMRQANLRSQAIGGALQTALQAAVDAVSPIGALLDEVEGLGFLRRLQQLDGERLGERLAGLLEGALAGPGSLLALCGEGPALEAAHGQLARDWELARIAAPPPPAEAPGRRDPCGEARVLRLLTVEVDGWFVAEAWPAPELAHEDAPLLQLLGVWLFQPLHERIRAKGGAYGARAAYDGSNRAFTFLSWRDPRLAGTLADYAALRGEALAGRIGDEELRQAKVEALRRLDTPLLPHERAGRAFNDRRTGQSDELRDAFRARLLDATVADLRGAASRWLGDEERARRVAVGPAGREQDREAAGWRLAVEELLPS